QGQAVVKEILLRNSPWSDLFEPAFFFTYRHYIVVIVSGEEKRCFTERCGLVESRMRVLVRNAENNHCVKIAHVNCRAYGKRPEDGRKKPF
uniref:PAP_RNA-bind domain-containing protein n=1 Tax=Mesocestoides corti TaxID=53468 RepID=A0A5K3G7H7_MESCO